MKKNDNRMQWIRMFEFLKTGKFDHEYIEEYEVLSECRIDGLLAYGDDFILMSKYSNPRPGDHHYSYLLKVRYAAKGVYNKNANAKGYYFHNSARGELLSLLSVFFGCRFFLQSTMTGELTDHGIKSKTNHKLSYIPCTKSIHPSIFNDKDKPRSFASKKNLVSFLDKVSNLNSDYHKNYIFACYRYLLGLRQVGADEEMVFIHLVSAIECLSQDFLLSPKDDPLYDVDMDVFRKSLKPFGFKKAQVQEVESILKNRKSKLKFIRFIEKYSKGFFKPGNYKRGHLNKPDGLKKVGAIYNVRSEYLHAGEKMFISNNSFGTDEDWSLSMIIDNHYFSGSKKLPTSDWFGRLVRHCLLTFLNENLIHKK